MKAYLLDGGYAALVAQAAASPTKMTFTKFQVGDALDADGQTTLAGAKGTVWFTGTASDMAYSQMSSDEAMIWCRIEHEDPTGVVGNVVLFCTLNDTEYPFMLMVPVPGYDNVKLRTSVHKSGMDLDVHLMLNIPSLLTRFNLGNLSHLTVTWLTADEDKDMPLPFNDQHDHMFIENHVGLARPVFATNINNQWHGCPLVYTIGDLRWAGQVLFDFGEQGDGYLYTEMT